MINGNNKIVTSIDAKFLKFMPRFLLGIKWYLVVLALIVLLHEILYRIEIGTLSIYIIILLIICCYCFFKSIDVLLKVEIVKDGNTVEVTTAHFNSIQHKTCSINDFEIKTVQDFSSRYKAYMIQIYIEKKIYFTQKQFGAWTKKKIESVATTDFHAKIKTLMVILMLSLSGCTMDSCLKDKVGIGDKYYFADTDLTEESSFLMFSDTGQIEYKDKRIFSISSLHWHNCSSYSLIIRSIIDTSILKVSDTVNFELLSYKNDTFYYEVKAKGKSMTSIFYRHHR